MEKNSNFLATGVLLYSGTSLAKKIGFFESQGLLKFRVRFTLSLQLLRKQGLELKKHFVSGIV
jgi:hypothetical protein